MRADLVGIAVAAAPGEGYYVNLGHHHGATPLSPDLVRKVLGPVLADPGISKVAHHGKMTSRADFGIGGLGRHRDRPPGGLEACDSMISLTDWETMIPITTPSEGRAAAHGRGRRYPGRAMPRRTR
jgi:hypothetical protein